MYPEMLGVFSDLSIVEMYLFVNIKPDILSVKQIYLPSGNIELV